MRQIQIQVYANVDARTNNKVLFERIVDCTDSIDIPYSFLLSSLKFMYGSSCIVCFSVL